MNRLFKLLPTYGNWGGIGWSGGEYPISPKFTNWNKEPIDSLDEIYKEHDRRYQIAIILYNGTIQEYREWIKADKMLLESIKKLPFNPKKWDNPNSGLYCIFYRYLSYYFFWLKYNLYKLVH